MVKVEHNSNYQSYWNDYPDICVIHTILPTRQTFGPGVR